MANKYIDEFKQNVVPFVTFIAATISLIGFMLSLCQSIGGFDDDIERWALVTNFGLHILLTTYVVVNGYRFSINFSDLYKSNPKIHEDFFFLPKRNKTNFIKFGNRAVIHLNQLLKYWTIICGVWTLFYLFLGIHVFVEEYLGDNGNLLFRGFFNFFNTIETAFFIGSYYILTSNSYKNNSFVIPKAVKAWWVILVFILIIDIILKVLKYHVELRDFSMIFDVLGGVLSCTFFSLFFARLNSKFLNFRISAIALLFFYASLQAIFPILNVFSTLISSSSSNLQYKNAIEIAFRYFFLFGYYFAFASKVVLYTILYSGKNRNKLFVYFMAVAVQEPMFKELQKNNKITIGY